MMDKSALEKIESMVTVGQGLQTDIPAVILPKEHTAHSLETLMSAPARLRQTFATGYINEFLGYVAAMANQHSCVYVRDDGINGVAILDHGTAEAPEWADHRANLTLRVTPEFEDMRRMLARPLSQRDLTDWLEDWPDLFKAHGADGKAITAAKAIGAIRRVEIKARQDAEHSDENLRQSKSTFASIEAKAKEGALPAEFRAAFAPYEGLEPAEITLTLAMRTGGSEPAFTLRLRGQGALERHIADEVHTRIKESLSIPVYIGTVKRCDGLG